MKRSRFFSAAASTTSTASRTAASRCRGTTVTKPSAPVSVFLSCVLCCECVCCECVCLTCASHKQTRPGRARTAPCSWPRSVWSAAWAVRILIWVDHLMHTMVDRNVSFYSRSFCDRCFDSRNFRWRERDEIRQCEISFDNRMSICVFVCTGSSERRLIICKTCPRAVHGRCVRYQSRLS
jgi:hypothetical protein